MGPAFLLRDWGVDSLPLSAHGGVGGEGQRKLHPGGAMVLQAAEEAPRLGGGSGCPPIPTGRAISRSPALYWPVCGYRPPCPPRGQSAEFPLYRSRSSQKRPVKSSRCFLCSRGSMCGPPDSETEGAPGNFILNCR